MTIEERISFTENVFKIATSHGYTGMMTSSADALLKFIVCDNDLAAYIWPAGWKIRQREILEFLQEEDVDGAIRYVADKL
jgi:hypothetical protein